LAPQVTDWETRSGQQIAFTPEKPVCTTVTIIIPVYNECRTALSLIQTVMAQPIGALAREVIIVDDFSTDGTREMLQSLNISALSRYPNDSVKLLLHPVNRGKGAAVRTALEAASGELILMQDADFEYDPRDYPALLQPILEGHADAVFGNRFHDGAHRVPRFYRFVLNRMFSMLCNMLTNLALKDVTACYKVFRRDQLLAARLHSDRFSFETEITVKLAKMGARIYEVPIVYHGRTYAEGKKISWSDGFAAAYHLFRYRFWD
jgi:glycosyltransferase involved in cell wall biosynthesis